MSRLLFTICGRAGSKGFLNKNLKELKGIPLVYYTLASIALYCNAHLEDQVTIAVNTDSIELMEQVKKQRLLPVCCVERKDDLAGDKAAKVHVIQDTYHQMRHKNQEYDAVIDLDLTSPLRRMCDIEGVVRELKENEDYDLTFSVVPSRRSPYFNMVERKADGYYKKICESDFTARQQAPKCYELNASIYAYRPSFLQGVIDRTILDYRCGIHEMPDFLVLDIDSEEDFHALEFLTDYYFENDEGIRKLFLEARKFN